MFKGSLPFFKPSFWVSIRQFSGMCNKVYVFVEGQNFKHTLNKQKKQVRLLQGKKMDPVEHVANIVHHRFDGTLLAKGPKRFGAQGTLIFFETLRIQVCPTKRDWSYNIPKNPAMS